MRVEIDLEMLCHRGSHIHVLTTSDTSQPAENPPPTANVGIRSWSSVRATAASSRAPLQRTDKPTNNRQSIRSILLPIRQNRTDHLVIGFQCSVILLVGPE